MRYLRVVVDSRPAIVLVAALALASAGCDRRADASTADASTADAGAADAGARVAPTPPTSAAPPPSSSASPEKPTLQLLKLVFTSEVKNKEPVDKLDRAQPGQRVWVHLTMRNRTGDTRPITVVFRVNGDQRSKVTLKIEHSWSYRTWAYNTLRASDLTGQLVVEIRDENGGAIANESLPIRQAGAGRPLPAKPERFDD